MQKRILSIILTLSIVATLFAGLSLNASAATNYAEKMTVSHSNYADGNLSLPTSGSVITKAPTISYWNYDSAAGTTTQHKTWYNTAKDNDAIAKLYDGNLGSTFESAYTSDNTNKYIKLKEGAQAGSTTLSDYESIDDGSFYVQIQYDLEDCYGNGVNLDKIIILGHQRQWTIGTYDLFVSDDIKTLYDKPVYSYNYLELNGNELTGYANSKKNFSEYTFEEGTTAKFIAIRIYKYHAMTAAGFTGQLTAFGIAHARVSEFNVYGTRSNANDQKYELITAPYNGTGGEETISAATTAGIGTNMSTSLIRDYSPVEYLFTDGDKSSTTDISNNIITQSDNFERFDFYGKVNGTNGFAVRSAGTDSKGYKYLIDDEDNYQQWIYKLDAEAKVESLVVATNQTGKYANTSGTLFAPYHVKYSLADSKENLFVEGKSKIYDVYNTESASFLTINLKEDVTAKYVALRVVCAVTKLYPYTDFVATEANNVAYVRLNYFGVNGTYVKPAEAEVAVTTEDGVPSSLVSQEKPVYTGNTDTYGKYPVGTVVVNATESLKDEANKKEYTFENWYNGNTPVSATAEYSYDLTQGNATLTAKYDVKDLVTTYNVHFVDATQKVIKTIEVVEGEYLNPVDVNKIVVKDIYGYNVDRDADGNVVWNDDIYENPVNGEITYTAQYRSLGLKTNVEVYDVDGTEIINRSMNFDTAIELISTQEANSWTDAEVGGNVLVGESTGKLYACGDAMQIYAKSDVVTEVPQVALVGKDHEYGKGFSIFAHVNIANADEYGVIYVNESLHSEKPEFEMDDVISESKRAQIIKTTATDIGKVDFMTTVTYRADTPYPTRWARAYVKVGDNYYYSHVVGNQ